VTSNGPTSHQICETLSAGSEVEMRDTRRERGDLTNLICFLKKEIFSEFVYVTFTRPSTVIIEVAYYKTLKTTMTPNAATGC
jgi:hypothetical protein